MRQIDCTEEIINNVQYKEALPAPLKHNIMFPRKKEQKIMDTHGFADQHNVQ